MTADRTPARTDAYALAQTPPALTRRSTPPIDHLFSTIVNASFDLIAELGKIDLSLYLHVPHDDQPLLFTRSPELHLLSPSEVFRLMHTITMLSNGQKPTAAFRHGELAGHYVRTAGEHSDGLFVFGPIQSTRDAQQIVSVTTAFARVLHQFHLDEHDQDHGHAPPSTEKVPHIAVSADGDHVVVEATPDGGLRPGIGTSSRAEDAVAVAVANALAPSWTFDEVRTIDVGRRSAVLVVLRDDRSILQLGLAISSGDVLQTTALATTRAVDQY